MLTWILNFRHTRDQTTIRATISRIRAEGRRLDDRMRADYEISAQEAMERLTQLRAAMLGVALFFSTRIPQDFSERESDQRDPGAPPH